MFIISKLIQTALQPSNILGILVVFATLSFILGRARFGKFFLYLAAALVVTAGWSPLGPAAVQVLEDRFSVPELPATITGIVMLGGAINTHITGDRDAVAVNDNAERIFVTASLARRFPNARVLLSGGAVELIKGVPVTESEGARRLLTDLGVGNERIELEEKSRTTFENAVESRTIADPKPGETWIVVTSGYNMPRAIASFRAAGFPVVPYPVDFRTRPADLRRPVSSLVNGLYMADIAAHEWLGLVVYRLTGKTQDAFPAPEK
jgi:uncharacterized SAM-binding protein YcdF (DUF218 family)